MIRLCSVAGALAFAGVFATQAQAAPILYSDFYANADPRNLVDLYYEAVPVIDDQTFTESLTLGGTDEPTAAHIVASDGSVRMDTLAPPLFDATPAATTTSGATVDEPSTLLLLGTGLTMLVVAMKRQALR